MNAPPLYNMPTNAGESYVRPLVQWLRDEAQTEVTYAELKDKHWQVTSTGPTGEVRVQTVNSWPEVVGIIRGIVVAAYT